MSEQYRGDRCRMMRLTRVLPPRMRQNGLPDVLRHDGHALGVDRACEAGVPERGRNQVRLRRASRSGDDGRRLEAEVRLEVLGDLADEALERSLRIRSSVDFW